MAKNQNPSIESDGKEFISEIIFNDSFQVDKDTKIRFKNLGEKFTEIEVFFFDYLKQYNIPSGFLKSEGKTKLLFEPHIPFPFSITISNAADKELAKYFDIKPYELLPAPVSLMRAGEFGQVSINESHLLAFEIASSNDIKMMGRMVSKMNAVLKSFFERRGAVLAEFQVRFGSADDKLLMIGDFTPVSMKVIPAESKKPDPNPYTLKTSQDFKVYSEYLHTLITG